MRFKNALNSIVLLAVTVTALVVPAFTLAQSTRPGTSENIDLRCADVTRAIETHLARYRNNYDRHAKVYARAKQMVENILKRLDGKDVDTGKLRADLKIWDEKILKVKTDFDSYIKELTETKEFACGRSEGQFKTALEEARKALRLVHQDISDVRNYYQTVIRSDIQALRGELRALPAVNDESL